MFTHPGDSEENERGVAFRKFGIVIPWTVLSGKQLAGFVLFFVLMAVSLLFFSH